MFVEITKPGKYVAGYSNGMWYCVRQGEAEIEIFSLSSPLTLKGKMICELEPYVGFDPWTIDRTLSRMMWGKS